MWFWRSPVKSHFILTHTVSLYGFHFFLSRFPGFFLLKESALTVFAAEMLPRFPVKIFSTYHTRKAVWRMFFPFWVRLNLTIVLFHHVLETIPIFLLIMGHYHWPAQKKQPGQRKTYEDYSKASGALRQFAIIKYSTDFSASCVKNMLSHNNNASIDDSYSSGHLLTPLLCFPHTNPIINPHVRSIRTNES